MTVLLYSLLFLVSVVVTLGACTLFTNAIEWLGKRLDLSEGAVGSVLAAIGTTLPETSIPIIAIFFGTSRAEAEVGLGAILGAPFMLSTLVVPILAMLLVVYARLGKRTAAFRLNYQDVKGDLSFFVVAYSVALGCVFIPSRLVHVMAAVGLTSLYLYYVKLKFSEAGEEGGEGGLEPLFFARKAAVPSFGLIGLQAVLGLAGLALGAHLFVLAAETIAGSLVDFPIDPGAPRRAPGDRVAGDVEQFSLALSKERPLGGRECHRRDGFSGYNPGLDRAPGHGLGVGTFGIGHHGARCGGGHLLTGAGCVGRSLATLVAGRERLLYIGYAVYLYGL